MFSLRWWTFSRLERFAFLNWRSRGYYKAWGQFPREDGRSERVVNYLLDIILRLDQDACELAEFGYGHMCISRNFIRRFSPGERGMPKSGTGDDARFRIHAEKTVACPDNGDSR